MTNPSLYVANPYPYKDFIPITLAAAAPNIVTVNPSLPVKSMKELIALLQANPGKYTIANAGRGTPPQLAAELLKLTYKLDAASVPYNGGEPAIQSTVGDHTPIAFSSIPPAAPQIAAGNLRGLAVAGQSVQPPRRMYRPWRRPASPIRNPKPSRVCSFRLERPKRLSICSMARSSS